MKGKNHFKLLPWARMGAGTSGLSKGRREHKVGPGRGSCIFGAMWFLLSQPTGCLALLVGAGNAPTPAWFILSHPLGNRGGGRGRRNLQLALKPPGQRGPGKRSKTQASGPPGMVPLEAGSGWGEQEGLGKGYWEMPPGLWQAPFSHGSCCEN